MKLTSLYNLYISAEKNYGISTCDQSETRGEN